MYRPLRVMLDARMLMGRFAGVNRFVTRLIDELVAQGGIEVLALCGSEVFPQWAGRNDIEIVTSTFRRADRTAARRLWWEECNLAGLIRQAKADLFHATWNSGVPALCPVPTVLTIHDLIPWSDPTAHFATALQRWSYRRAVRCSARRGSCITTVSDYVRGQVLHTLSVDAGKVVTVPNGVHAPDRELNRRPMTSPPYALYVGGHEPRKNVAGLFRAMRRYWERFDKALELRLTGDRTSLCPEAAEVYERLADKSRVRFLRNVDDAELARHYADAQVLLMLSRDEGFGLPALEAMAHGCPVVAASSASLPEVVGDAGLLVDPDDADAVCDAVRLLVTSSAARGEFLERGRLRARAFGWDKTARRMREIYERVAHEPIRSSLQTACTTKDPAVACGEPLQR
jgi:glycosyltransferase involved in cell wall biosynthesis